MSYCTVTLTWPGGEHQFSLDWAQLRALEGITDMGPMALMQAMQANIWRLDHLLNTLRLGLIGAGVDTLQARKLVMAAAELHPPVAFVNPAILALGAGVMGINDTSLEDKGPEDGGTT